MRNHLNKNEGYYVSPFPERYIETRQLNNVLTMSLALAAYVIMFVIWIFSDFKSLIWISGSFDGQMVFLLMFLLGMVGVLFCHINNFYGYRIRKQVKASRAPIFGFKRTAYNGQLITLVLVSALSIFLIVIFVGYHIALGADIIDQIIAKNPLLEGKTGGFDRTGVAMLFFSILGTVFTWAYYMNSFKANKVMMLVDDATAASGKYHFPMFKLTDEELTLSQTEFESKSEDDDKEE